MIKEHDRIVLNAPVPSEGLEPGDVGAVVHVYEDGKAYEVEFVTLDGHTTVATVEAAQVRPVSRGDITHVRELQVACGLVEPQVATSAAEASSTSYLSYSYP